MRNDTLVKIVIGAVILGTVAIIAFPGGNGESRNTEPVMSAAEARPTDVPEGMDRAVLAGGCFWGVEGVFERLEGVDNAMSGYSGGDAKTAYYNIVSSGRTDHAESVEIIYDPSTVTYETLLEVFFTVAHDPTQLNYQKPDHGTQYRSAIFYADEEQKRIAEEYIRKLDASGAYQGEIVTEVSPLDAFYPAEEYHQDFMRNNPRHMYIVQWDVPKIEHLEREFPELLSSGRATRGDRQ